MNEQVDARGLSGPEPVLETKKILDALKEGSVTTIVDNEAAMQKVKNLAESMSYCVNIQEIEGDYYIHIYKGEISQDVRLQSSKKKDLVILFGRDTMGQGSAELGGCFSEVTSMHWPNISLIRKRFCLSMTVSG